MLLVGMTAVSLLAGCGREAEETAETAAQEEMPEKEQQGSDKQEGASETKEETQDAGEAGGKSAYGLSLIHI